MAKQIQRNRVHLTLDDDLYKVLTELSALSGKPRATIIHDLLNDAKPHLRISIELLKKLKANELELKDTKVKETFLDLVGEQLNILDTAQDDFAKLARDTANKLKEEIEND